MGGVRGVSGVGGRGKGSSSPSSPSSPHSPHSPSPHLPTLPTLPPPPHPPPLPISLPHLLSTLQKQFTFRAIVGYSTNPSNLNIFFIAATLFERGRGRWGGWGG
ncbi:MAG: hypothetical protein RMY29_013365 [Nostoc sp. CreGUA01]